MLLDIALFVVAIADVAGICVVVLLMLPEPENQGRPCHNIELAFDREYADDTQQAIARM